ncbi:hypothetical protein EV715DRAFT_285422 [Schizophyllum commune]
MHSRRTVDAQQTNCRCPADGLEAHHERPLIVRFCQALIVRFCQELIGQVPPRPASIDNGIFLARDMNLGFSAMKNLGFGLMKNLGFGLMKNLGFNLMNNLGFNLVKNLGSNLMRNQAFNLMENLTFDPDDARTLHFDAEPKNEPGVLGEGQGAAMPSEADIASNFPATFTGDAAGARISPTRAENLVPGVSITIIASSCICISAEMPNSESATAGLRGA